MADAEMTPDIEAFFKTGELPASMKDEAAASAAAAATAAAVAAAAPAPTPAPVEILAPASAPTPAPDPAAELRQILESERRARTALEARMAQIAQQLEKANAPAPMPAPDPTTDPLGAMMHQMQTINSNVETLQNKLSQSEMQNYQQTQFQTFVGNLQRVRDEFTKTTPDFQAAYAHLRNSRMEDLRDAGVSEDVIPNAMIQDEIAIAQNAINTGKNPAQVIYNMAKRYGYKGAAAAAAPAATPADRIKQAAALQAADTVPGRAATDNSVLTPEGLRDASDEALSKVARDDKLWAQLVGGNSPDIFHR